jgi:hypothetical protein
MARALPMHIANGKYLASRWSSAFLLVVIATLLNSCGGDSGGSLDKGTATLTWGRSKSTVPTGYRIYYGTIARSYLQEPGEGIAAENGTSHTVTGLTRGSPVLFHRHRL